LFLNYAFFRPERKGGTDDFIPYKRPGNLEHRYPPGQEECGFLAPEKALKLLLIGPEYTQFAIKTEKAAAQLHWTSSETIEKAEVGALKSEQAAYAKAFAKEMERIAEE